MKESFEAMNRLFESIIPATSLLGGEDLWWRGQPKKGLPLKPKVHRGCKDVDHYREFNLIHNFIRQAHIRYKQWPQDRCHQLVLMQHYGLSTRLLDWSLRFFPALYFAVKDEEQMDVPASLWAMNPRRLNKLQFPDSHTNIFRHDSKEVGKIVNSAFDNISDGGNRALAMTSPEVDLRMFVQCSVFTIHESINSMEDLQTELGGKFLYEIEIPEKEKYLLRQALDIFGISHSRLFPDLQALAEELEARYASI